MKHIVLFVCILFFLSITSPPHAYSETLHIIKAPYPLPVKNVDDGYNQPKDIFQSCPEPSSVPPKTLEFYSVYNQTDPTRSTIDPVAEKIYKRATKNIATYEQRLINFSNSYIKSPAQNSAYATCALDWLYQAAKQGSYTDSVNRGGINIRQWGLATVASAYIQIKQDPFLDSRRKKVVEKWLRKLATQVIADYPYNSPLKSKNNNHLYWAAWAVTASSVAINDTDFFLWGIHQFKLATLQINPDGTLPLELARKGKALQYHLFSLTPLVMIAETAARNNINLYDFRQGYFHKLVTQSLKGLDDPSYFESVALAPQIKGSDVSSSQLTWIEPYNTRFPTPQAQQWIEKRAPTKLRRVGGNTSLLYNQ